MIICWSQYENCNLQKGDSGARHEFTKEREREKRKKVDGQVVVLDSGLHLPVRVIDPERFSVEDFW